MHAERFASRPRCRRWLARSLAVLAVASLAGPVFADTLERIRSSGRINIGYLDDARPFSYRTDAGGVDGYAVALCRKIVEQAQPYLKIRNLKVNWVVVSASNRFDQVHDGNIDLLCAPSSVTLTRRRDVAFSIPIFPGGARAVVRADAPVALTNALAETPAKLPVWRGSPAAKVLQKTTFGVVAETTTEQFLKTERKKLELDSRIVTVANYREGLQQLLDRKIDVFMGDRALAVSAISALVNPDGVRVLDRLFTREPLALALPRDDDDFRLLVDQALSNIYASAEFQPLYQNWFGEYSDNTRIFFQWTKLAQQ